MPKIIHWCLGRESNFQMDESALCGMAKIKTEGKRKGGIIMSGWVEVIKRDGAKEKKATGTK